MSLDNVKKYYEYLEDNRRAKTHFLFKGLTGKILYATSEKVVLYMVETFSKNKVDGDFIEMGSLLGQTSIPLKMMCDTYERKLHVYDTFYKQRIVTTVNQRTKKISLSSALVNTDTDTTEMLTNFKNNFEHFGKALPEIHQGNILWQKEFPEKIALAYIDCDFEKPILYSLQNIYPRMAKGGKIYIHDYAHHIWGAGVKKAIETFLVDKPDIILETPFDNLAEITK